MKNTELVAICALIFVLCIAALGPIGEQQECRPDELVEGK